MKKNKSGIIPVNLIVAAVVAVILAVAFTFFLSAMKTSVSVSNQKDRSQIKLEDVGNILSQNSSDLYGHTQIYNRIGNSKVKSIAKVFQNNEKNTISEGDLQDMVSAVDVGNIYVLSKNKDIIRMAYETDIDFHASRYNELFTAFDRGTSEPFTITENGEDIRWYACDVDKDRIIAVSRNPEELNYTLKSFDSLSNTLGGVTVGSDGFLMAVSADLLTVKYHPDSKYIDNDVMALGMTSEQLKDGYNGWVTLGGQKYYASVKDFNGEYILVACVPDSEISSTTNYVLIAMLVLFVIFAVAIIGYGYSARVELIRNKAALKIKKFLGLFINISLGKKLAEIALSCVIIIFALSMFMQTLYQISSQAVDNKSIVAAAKEKIENNKNEEQYLTDYYNQRYLAKCRTASYIITRNPELLTREYLLELCQIVRVQAIYVFNADGKCTSTSTLYSDFSIQDDKESQSYEFNPVINGYTEYLIQTPQKDEFGEYSQYIATATHNEKGNVNGMVQIMVDPSELDSYLAPTKISSVLSGVKTGNSGFAFAVNKKTKAFSYYPDESYIGQAAEDYGVTDFALKDDFSDFITINGVKYFATSGETSSDYIYACAPVSSINSTRLTVSAATAAACLVAGLIICIILMLTLRDDRQVEVRPANEDESFFTAVMPDGKIRKIRVAAQRWDGHRKFSAMTVGEKMFFLAKILMSLVGIGIFVIFVASDKLLSEDSMIRYIIAGNWERRMGIFSVTCSVMMFIAIYFVTSIIRKIFITFAKNMSSRGETVGRLLDGIIKYVSVIIAIYYCMSLMGINTSTLLASAGIVSVVVGLGAQSLIGDLLAGLFIVFEGEFRVGDIVTIGTWRGIVLEIGFRTTKIEDVMSNNIKIFNNSKITDIVNMTKKHSCASCDVSIEYNESLERVERVLEEEFPNIREHLPAIKGGPFYKGVIALADSGVNIRIVAQCSERDRIQLDRDLNREIKLVFDKHHINIPFPQVVINQPVETEPYLTTESDKVSADSFVEKQKEDSKDVFV